MVNAVLHFRTPPTNVTVVIALMALKETAVKENQHRVLFCNYNIRKASYRAGREGGGLKTLL